MKEPPGKQSFQLSTPSFEPPSFESPTFNPFEAAVESGGFPNFAQFQPAFAEMTYVGAQDGTQRHDNRVNVYDGPILAFDTEYQALPNGSGNHVLCYSYCIGVSEDEYSHEVIYTKSKAKQGRISLRKLIETAVQKAIEEEVLNEYPEQLTIVAHFLRADLTNLSDIFDSLKLKLSGVRKTILTIKDSYGVDVEREVTKDVGDQNISYYDKSRHRKNVKVRFLDTMLLAPAGKSLADIGELIGIPKLEIPEPYSIENIKEYLHNCKQGFEQYALRDAEIAYVFMHQIREFVHGKLGLNRAPTTIGGIAVQLFRRSLNDFNTSFGMSEATREYWPDEGHKPRTVTYFQPCFGRGILESLAISCYHGGRNEAFYMGPTPVGEWYDFDIPSCYTVALANLRALDYDRFKQVYTVEDFLGDVYGLARVQFKFPESVKYPSLPVRVEPYGLMFVREGVSVCTAPEIQTAHYLGAEITILQGFVIPWLNDEQLFLPFIQQVRENRLNYEKGGFEERLWKEIGNSLYGKLAQGLSGKSAFEVESGLSKTIPPSSITNPFFAAYATGLPRAALGEMLAGLPEDKLALSVTTDGFLTDAQLSEINLSGPACKRYKELYHQVDPSGGEILELKHKAKQLLIMKTRGASTLVPSEGFEPVIAKAGVQIPRKTPDPMDYFNRLYLAREPGQKVVSKRLTSTRDQFLQEKDLMSELKEITLNLEPDMKRSWCSPATISTHLTEHLAMTSEPWQNAEEAQFCRVRFDKWRESSCLKTVSDWESFSDFLAMSKCTQNTTLRIKSEERSDQFFVRMFVRAYAQEELGLQRSMTYKQLAEWLNGLGYEIKESTIASSRTGRLDLGVVPKTAYVERLVNKLVGQFPSFEHTKLIAD